MAVELDSPRVLEDLTGEVRGELLFDDLSRALYSTDASIFQVRPLGVVVPADEQDVQTVVRYAAEHHIPITGRGAGSGLAGESLTAGLVLDFSRHFRAIREVGSETVTVQPGVVYRELNERLATVGRRLAPDPASGAQCTLGGMIATNASGARALKYGYMRDYVQELRVVLDNGDAETFAAEPRGNSSGDQTRKQQILAALVPWLEQNVELIRSCQPITKFNRCGYLLQDLLTLEAVHLARLVVGSEGTLALFTEARLRTIPLPQDRALVLLGFGSLDAAARTVQQCLPLGPSACELLERRLLTLTFDVYPEYKKVVSPGTQAVLLVEFESGVSGEAQASAQSLLRRCQQGAALTAGRVAGEPAEIHWLWQLRELAVPVLHAMPGKAQALAFIEDVGVPTEQLGHFIHRVQEIMQRHETTASFLIHGGAGQVHTRPFLDLKRPDHVTKLWELAEEVYHLALDLGGTISTQHGVGLARTPWVARQYGRLYPVFREIKSIFDPQHLFNPGKIVEALAPELASETPAIRLKGQLRRDAQAENGSPNGRTPLLRWTGEELRTQCRHCNGCGACRTEEVSLRMCPLFRVHGTEAATPRAKANLLRSLLDGSLPPEQITSDEVRGVADLCFNCKMCGIECPAHVNIPKLMLEAKAIHCAENGLRRSDWVMARTERFAAFGSKFATLVNAGLRSMTIRWLLEKILGVSRWRRLPRFARRSFMNLAARRGWTKPNTRGLTSPARRVAYFVDVYANYNDPQIGEATVAVLQHNDIEVYVPPGQIGCGMAPLAYGDVETAKRTAEQNLRLFAELARAGYSIVCSEPTAALMLRQDCADLVDDPDVQRVADQTTELTTFLWELHGQGRLKTDFQPLDFAVGHHVPCHLKALQTGVAGPQLLSLIPGLKALTMDISCSGMAGTFGLKEENFDVSLATGKPMLDRLRREDLLFGSSECSACRMQMEEGARKRSLHPVQYLALAYGLMPEIEQRLREPIRDLVL